MVSKLFYIGKSAAISWNLVHDQLTTVMCDSIQQTKCYGRTWRKRQRIKARKPRQSCAQLDEFVSLRVWMKQKQFTHCYLEPVIFPDTGRGLMTKQRMNPGDVIISIPETLLITTCTILKSGIGEIIKRWKPKLSPQQAIAVFLIWEKSKGDNSYWHPYIHVLPEAFNTSAFFTGSDIGLLPKHVQHRAVESWKKLKKAYQDIHDFCKDQWKEFHNKLTLKSFCWAWYVINTRSVYYKQPLSPYLSDEDDVIALAPYLDMLNHSPSASVDASFNNVNRCYEIKTYNFYRKFDQVFINYGPHDNRHLFLEYGFIVPNNLQDVYDFTIDDLEILYIECQLDFWDKKMCILRENQLLKSLCCSEEGLSWNMWTVLRTFAMDWPQLQLWKRIFQDSKIPDSVKSAASSLAQALLQRAIQNNRDQLQHFAQVIEDREISEHQTIARDLLQIDQRILNLSLKQLTIEDQDQV